MWHDLLAALCLVLIFEGMLPFLSPSRWRKMAATVALLDNRSVRIMGLISMVIGATVLSLIKS